MDDQLLRTVYHRLFDSGNLVPRHRCLHSDSIIVLLYMLAAYSDRSPRWAALPKNWPLWMRRLTPPSYSQLIRRLKTRSVQLLIARINCEATVTLPRGDTVICDGKPLTVGGYSKDPDTRCGKLPGNGWGRGYKLHVIIDAACGVVELFTVTPLNAGEPTVMRRLVQDASIDGQLMRGDSNYDSNTLYQTICECGGRLIAPRKKPFTKLGHHQHHPDRLRAIRELEQSPETMRAHRRVRAEVERRLGHLTNLPFGLSPLPNFVRRQRRVSLWILAKITLYHLNLFLTQKQTAVA